jgi:hypothetical protein
MGDAGAVVDMETRFRALPDGARAACFRMLAWPYPEKSNPATDAELAAFKTLPGGVVLLDRFGRDARLRVGIFLDRYNSALQATPPAEVKAVRDWWDAMPDLEKCCIVHKLALAG